MLSELVTKCGPRSFHGSTKTSRSHRMLWIQRAVAEGKIALKKVQQFLAEQVWQISVDVLNAGMTSRSLTVTETTAATVGQ